MPTAPATPPRPAVDIQPVAELFQLLIVNGTLGRVWWLVSRKQRMRVFDPRPQLAPFNTLHQVDVNANPPTVLAVNVTRPQQFRGILLYAVWNYVVLR